MDWHLNENDFPEVPAANLSTDRITADGDTWLDFADCLSRPMDGGSAFSNIEGSAIDGQESACKEIQEILSAQLVWESHTGVEFVPHRRDEEAWIANWLKVTVSKGAYANTACSYNAHRWATGGISNVIGYQSSTEARNTLRLGRRPEHYCIPQTYVHEFGHVLGLWHTQGRQDRDAWLAMGTGATTNPNNWRPTSMMDVGPFDYRSIMLYHSYATNGDGNHLSGIDCADASPGEPCGRVLDRTVAFDPITFELSDVYNMIPYQLHTFGTSRLRRIASIEPLEGEDCFPESILHERRVRVSPAHSPWPAIADTAGEPTLTLPLTELFQDPAGADFNPNLNDYSCYEILRDGPDASNPHLSRGRLDPDDPNWTFNSGISLSTSARQGARLSPTDISSAFAVYVPGRINPGSELGDVADRFGVATASGDFDGDGVQDIAIAAPGAFTVFVFKGVYEPGDDSGLISHRPWLALDATGATTLAVGDFDNDGFDDLAVGRSEQDAVRVFSRLGERGYLQNVTSITATGFSGSPIPSGWPPTAFNNAFGTALAVADFDGDGRDDLAVGCPACYPANYDISLHEPASAPMGWGGWTERTGAVYLLRGDDVMSAGLPTAAPVLKAEDPVIDPYSDPGVRGSHVGSQFGHAVTFGHHISGGAMKLFVGAPDGHRFQIIDAELQTKSYLSGTTIRVGNVYEFLTTGSGSSAALAFNGVSTEDEQDSSYGFAVDSPVGDEWAPFQGALLVGSPTALVPHHSGAVPAGAVHGYAIPPLTTALGSPTVRLDGRAIDTEFSDCAIAPNNGFGSAIGHGLTLGQTFAAVDQLPMVAIGSPRRQVGCSNITTPSFGAVSTWVLEGLRDDIVNADPPSSPAHYIPNPDPAPTGPTGFGSDVCFLRPSTWSFIDLDGEVGSASTASDFAEGQVGLILGAELGIDTRGGAPGEPTGIVRKVDPQAGGAVHVRPALFQGW